MTLVDEILLLSLRQSEAFWKDDLEMCDKLTERMHRAVRKYGGGQLEDEPEITEGGDA